jgi:hypothetical protein
MQHMTDGGRLTFVTITDPMSLKEGKCDDYLGSIARFGYNPTVLTSFDQKLGCCSKIFEFHRFLSDAASGEDMDRHFVFTDAHDVLLINHPSAILYGLELYGCDVVLGAEVGFCHQNEETRSEFDEWFSHAPFRYLNGGFVAGTKRSLLRFYEAVLRHNGPPRPGTREQWFLGEFLARARRNNSPADRATLDCHARIITTISSSLPLPAEITSPLVHVTWLQNPIQRAKYDSLKARLSI